jgi:hypothetical protein
MLNQHCGRRRKFRLQDQAIARETSNREKIVNRSGASELREPSAPYNGGFMPENDRLSATNMHFLDIYHENKTT